MSHPPKHVVLLAAGRGSRMSGLADEIHKSMLPIAGRPPLQYAIDEVLASGADDVVIVTGHLRSSIETFVQNHYGNRVRTVFNEDYAKDTNILSTELGVDYLRDASSGYLIIETDMVIAPNAWRSILDVGDGCESFWVTRGFYSKALTGGALEADEDDTVTGLVYAPEYNREYEGWQKLLGMLYVGSDQVAADRAFRQAGIRQTISQYYMTPWVEHLDEMPCNARQLGEVYAASYNDLLTYKKVDREYAAMLNADDINVE